MKISQTVFNLKSGHEYRVEVAIFNIQRAITPKVGKSELWLICSACCMMVLYICMKLRENITNGIRVMERTRVHGRNGWFQYSKGNNSKSRKSKPMAHVFCTLSDGALHWCEVS